jgi:hypothetical protein
MMNDMFRAYEEKYAEPRHRENTESMSELRDGMNKMRGAMWAVGIIFTVVMAAVKIFHK